MHLLWVHSSPTYLFPKVLRYAKQSLLSTSVCLQKGSVSDNNHQALKHSGDATNTPVLHSLERTGLSCSQCGLGECMAQVSHTEIKAAHQVNSMWGNEV